VICNRRQGADAGRYDVARGFERRYYQRIESGTVNLSLKSLNKLAKAFRVSIPELMQLDWETTKAKERLGKRWNKKEDGGISQ
jgi:transcriptional regulator with XRE-family HTH domain